MHKIDEKSPDFDTKKLHKAVLFCFRGAVNHGLMSKVKRYPRKVQPCSNCRDILNAWVKEAK